MKIVIVAGGLATRMKPLTEDIPKCLIDVNGKPLIQHQLEFFKKNGFTEFIFCVAHLAEKVKEYLRDGRDFGLRVRYVQETKKLMGTAGSVKLAQKLIGKDEDFIVYYGDSLTSMDFHKFITFHKEKQGDATIVMRPLPDGYKSSSLITLHKDGKVRNFVENPSAEQLESHKNEKKFINSGVYAFNKKVFERIPDGVKYDFAKQLFPSMIDKDLGVYGYVTTEFFREIGRVDKYDAFLEEFKDRREIL